ncbi:MAG TPA: CRISPR-associated endonuclease Cas2 [Blastocatellia bacterium]|nr:CRISPR-associated endonuclease Cas2 [Blastocatellia bacterium]
MGEDVGRYGEAVQFSLFGCILAPDQFDEMRREVAAILDHEDLWRVRYYEVCGECQRKTVTLGKAFTTKLKRVYIV